MVELIVTEKPQAAEKIATALSDSKPIKKTKGRSVYYELKRGNKKILVGCAVGHLYGLAEKTKTKWGTYPVFDIVWKPKYEIDKNADYTKSYLNLLKELAKKADTFTVATDYDLEGSVIGHNIIKQAFKQTDAKRMKFSTLTKDELNDSYNKASKHLDFNLIHAGETRHYIDWIYGINITGALSSAIKDSSGRFRILSSGRVQGPTLKIIVDREKEIQKFKPTPYWEIFLDGLHKKSKILAKHKEDKFKDEKKVKEILKKTKGKKAIISSLKKSTHNQNPPTPFDLTSLQVEAFRVFKITPKETSQLAQDLYTRGLISYPRTSSQKLPASIGYKKILQKLSKNEEYEKLCTDLLKTKLKPNEGKKNDPAHPAIYPTGEKEKVAGRSEKLYDLIVRRFFAVFGEPAKRETISVEIDVNKEIFTLSGTKTIEKGWHVLYGKYATQKEEELPEMKEGEEIKVKKIYDERKETQPPKRYTQASIIKTMEKYNLGTKATRAMIVDTLNQREYLQNDPIEATELGIMIVDTLNKYLPEILDIKLTSQLEKEMEQVRENKKKKDDIIKKEEKFLTKILEKFKTKEMVIGKELSEATLETEKKMNEYGLCPACKKNQLRILFSKNRKRFLACSGYPKCKTTFSLPQTGLIKKTDKPCKVCGYPVVLVIRKGKRPWSLCINPDCKSKENWNNNTKKP